jgi:hypothetical protein
VVAVAAVVHLAEPYNRRVLVVVAVVVMQRH